MGELSVSLCSTKVAGLSHVEQAWTGGRVVLWMCSVERLLRFTEGREFQHLLLHVLDLAVASWGWDASSWEVGNSLPGQAPMSSPSSDVDQQYQPDQ